MLNNNVPSSIIAIAALCREVSAAILLFYGDTKRMHIQDKSNHTPLTDADLTAHRLLVRQLPDIIELPVISEESSASVRHQHLEDYWLIDPIDGTSEFIAGTGQFCIAIARISKHRPTLGFIHSPMSGESWFAIASEGAYKMTAEGDIQALHCRALPTPPTIITAHHSYSKRMRHFLEQTYPNFQDTIMGSALKFCQIAEGKADIYPKISNKTSEWDTAAGDILLHEAGGGLRFYPNHTQLYGTRETSINPPFIAYGSGVTEAMIQRWFTSMEDFLVA